MSDEALRSALVTLMNKEEVLPSEYLPEFNFDANKESIVVPGRFIETRIGSVCAPNDVLDVSQAAMTVAAHPIFLPLDRMSTTVPYSDYAILPDSVEGQSLDEESFKKKSEIVINQRKQHKISLMLQIAYTNIK